MRLFPSSFLVFLLSLSSLSLSTSRLALPHLCPLYPPCLSLPLYLSLSLCISLCLSVSPYPYLSLLPLPLPLDYLYLYLCLTRTHTHPVSTRPNLSPALVVQVQNNVVLSVPPGRRLRDTLSFLRNRVKNYARLVRGFRQQPPACGQCKTVAVLVGRF